MPVATGKVLSRHVAFSSPGKSAGKSRSPCVCSIFPVSTALAVESRAKSSNSSSSSNTLATPGGFALDSQAVTVGRRVEVNNVVPAKAGFSQGITAAPEQANRQTQRKPGRPQGHAAWNKGKSMSANVKKQISESQKTRWKQKPELHALVSSKLKGLEPWNKGKHMRPETCQRMSAARQGCTLPKAVCAKISQARTGQLHSKATRMKMSATRTGVALSSETRARIAATQRRRHAASRVLQAVEAFHREWDVAKHSGDSNNTPSSTSPMRKKRRMVKCLSGRVPPGKPATRASIMAAYKLQLREYRALQEELGPWTQAFKAQHGRKPCLSDVERTGIDWLLSKFKAYVMLRDRLLTDTSILRDKLDVAVPEFANGMPPPVKMASYATKLNANAASAKRTRSAGTVSAALEYRRQQQALAETAAISAAADTAAGAAAAAIADAAADAEDIGREAVRVATADLQQLHLNEASGEQALPMTHDHDNSNGISRPDTSGANDQPAVVFSNGTSLTASESMLELHHEQTQPQPRTADDINQTANEAASDSKASVSTASPLSDQSVNDHLQNGSVNGAATHSDVQLNPTNKDAHTSEGSHTAGQDGGAPARTEDRIAQQPARRKSIPTPLPGTSPRIKSALLAAEQYRKQKAEKTAALALAAANAAARTD